MQDFRPWSRVEGSKIWGLWSIVDGARVFGYDKLRCRIQGSGPRVPEIKVKGQGFRACLWWERRLKSQV